MPWKPQQQNLKCFPRTNIPIMQGTGLWQHLRALVGNLAPAARPRRSLCAPGAGQEALPRPHLRTRPSPPCAAMSPDCLRSSLPGVHCTRKGRGGRGMPACTRAACREGDLGRTQLIPTRGSCPQCEPVSHSQLSTKPLQMSQW